MAQSRRQPNLFDQQDVRELCWGRNRRSQQRRTLHARYVAALTEFWRCHRQAAAVMHFCGLGYSRPGDKPRPEGGATCDDFIDTETTHVRAAVCRVRSRGVQPRGADAGFLGRRSSGRRACGPLEVIIINDLEQDWNGPVRLRIVQGDKAVAVGRRMAKLRPSGSRRCLRRFLSEGARRLHDPCGNIRLATANQCGVCAISR